MLILLFCHQTKAITLCSCRKQFTGVSIRSGIRPSTAPAPNQKRGAEPQKKLAQTLPIKKFDEQNSIPKQTATPTSAINNSTARFKLPNKKPPPINFNKRISANLSSSPNPPSPYVNQQFQKPQQIPKRSPVFADPHVKPHVKSFEPKPRQFSQRSPVFAEGREDLTKGRTFYPNNTFNQRADKQQNSAKQRPVYVYKQHNRREADQPEETPTRLPFLYRLPEEQPTAVQEFNAPSPKLIFSDHKTVDKIYEEIFYISARKLENIKASPEYSEILEGIIKIEEFRSRFQDMENEAKSKKLEDEMTASAATAQTSGQNEPPVEMEIPIPTPSKKQSAADDVLSRPTQISLEILSNGTTHISPSVLIRTPLRVYLFNCPEGVERFFYALRLRSMVVNDFFFTRSQWNNIAGLGAILLVRANPYLVFGHATPGEITQCTLFGPPNIRKYLEYMRPFFDSGTTDVRYPVVLKEHTYNEKMPYEDNTLRVHQIPIFPPEQQSEDNSESESKEYVGLQNLQQVDVAFLVELKKGPKAINASKLIALEVPNGPLIGQLKAGKAVKLPDGRVIKPEQVYDDRQKDERGTLLVVELESIAKLPSLSGSPVLQKFMNENRTEQLEYAVHFTRQSVLQSSEYAQWMASFGKACTHIILNGGGPVAPQIDRIYRAQMFHRKIFPEAFPQLYPLKPLGNFGEDGVTTVHPDRGGFRVENVIAPTPIRRFPMRGALTTATDLETAIMMQPFIDELRDRLNDSDNFNQAIRSVKNFVLEKRALRKQQENKAASVSTESVSNTTEGEHVEMETAVTNTDSMDTPASPVEMKHTDIVSDCIESKERAIDALNKELTNLPQFHEDSLKADGSLERYPQIAFLGTSSAIPGAYRNVSSTLVELSPTAAILVDVGEGTVGQMRVLYGPDKLSQLLLRLNAIFTTHSHQDHVHGLNGVIIARLEAFKNAGIPYKPLLLVCNRNFRRLLNFYSTNFQNLENCIRIVDISMYPGPIKGQGLQQYIPKSDVEKTQQEHFLNNCNRLFINLMDHMPEIQDWGCALTEAKAVHVLHTKMAVGFVFKCGPPMHRKLVFSGDTTPCPLLIEHGEDADLLIHECTFEDGFEKDAKVKKHCTMRQATNVAKEMRAKNVIFNHFSARYVRIPPIPDYLIEAGNISFAMDGMIVRFDTLPMFPKLLPVFKHLYHRDLFNLYTTKLKRKLRVEQEQQKEMQEEMEQQRAQEEQRQKHSAATANTPPHSPRARM